MNIVKREPGIVLLIHAGQINGDIRQLKITEKEFARIEKGEISMEGVVNYYDNCGLCSAGRLRDSLIKDYLRTVSGYSEKRLDSILSKLKTHTDIYLEFYDFILDEQFPEDGIAIEGFTARQLFENFKLTPLGAYNYLICLREHPAKAIADLKAGLPKK